MLKAWQQIQQKWTLKNLFKTDLKHNILQNFLFFFQETSFSSFFYSMNCRIIWLEAN